MDIVLLAAVAENGVIGRGNALPWRLKSDMQHFRAVTMGKPVVMGRKTFLSIGKPLHRPHHDRGQPRPRLRGAGRRGGAEPRCRPCSGARRCAAPRFDAIIVAGGADIYAQALPLATRLAITEVHKRVEGDTYFPAIDPQIWRETAAASSNRQPRTKLPSLSSPTNAQQIAAVKARQARHNCAL